MLLTLLSAIFGGALRLAPEILKFMGQKDQDAHELAMQDKQYLFQQLQGKQQMEAAQVQGDINLEQQQLQTIQALNAAQAQMAVAGGKFTSGLNAVVRPFVAFYVFALWGAHEMTALWYAYQLSGNATQAVMNSWTPDDASMLAMIAAFYFVGRSIDKSQGMG